MESDVMLYVVGGPEENEVLLYGYDSLLSNNNGNYMLIVTALSSHCGIRSISY